jgi:TPP-dependent indolepyruvate ferredoxin oxidoreductase alpha subunit
MDLAVTSSSKYLAIDDDACHLCARCLVMRACRGMAVVRFDRDEAPYIDPARCAHCLACLDKCPFGALVWK